MELVWQILSRQQLICKGKLSIDGVPCLGTWVTDAKHLWSLGLMKNSGDPSRAGDAPHRPPDGPERPNRRSTF